MSKRNLRRLEDIESKLKAMVTVDVEVLCGNTGNTIKKVDGKGLRSTVIKVRARI